MNDKSQYWIDTAQYDIDTAQAMLDTKRYLYVGLMCHQTAEKALKAIIAKDETAAPPKIHHLPKLATIANIFETMTEEQQDLLHELNPLNIESRYPSYKDDIAASLNDGVCKSLIKKTGELLCWIKQQL
ncbi:MAG: HEPN domain-containing protein [Oscillospiraceae bacterium]